MPVAFPLFFVVGLFLVFAPSMIALLTGTDLEKLGPASEEFLILHRRIWPAVLVVLAGVFVYTLVFSHRTAGPTYRINSVLQMMRKGEYPKMVTRRKGSVF